LGTPQKLTGVNGAVVWSAKYSSFGEAQVEVETVENNLRLPGQYYDQETGLYYNFFRYYDTKTGRYLRADPIGLFSGELNIGERNHLYLYAKVNPANLQDPYGLLPMDPRCWYAVWKAKKECGEKYDSAVQQAHDYFDWCEKAWWYCYTNGQFIPTGTELSCNQQPSKDECKHFKKYGCASDARKSCMDSPQFKNFVGQTAICVKAAVNAGRKCLWF
ncbi:MAG: RHS repeat-associated core domain-containing protein, partial [Thermodesulfobacteriota bacterium]|nr:RHS repeat-associated core domain-containing protein [Thermodesulfobacteriota bacterium]